MNHDLSLTPVENVELVNVLPPVTREELFKKANVRLTQPRNAKREVFYIDIKVGGGSDFKSISVLPGDSATMPVTTAKEVFENHKVYPSGECAGDPGLAWIDAKTDRAQAIINALRDAEMFYETTANRGMESTRSSRRDSDDDVVRNRSSAYGSFHLAQAKADIIREHREKLESELESA